MLIIIIFTLRHRLDITINIYWEGILGEADGRVLPPRYYHAAACDMPKPPSILTQRLPPAPPAKIPCYHADVATGFITLLLMSEFSF